VNLKNRQRVEQLCDRRDTDADQAAKRATMQRACLAHHNYLLWQDARNAAEKLARKNPPFIFNVFKCPVCGWWHVGRPNKQEQINAVKWLEFVAKQQGASA